MPFELQSAAQATRSDSTGGEAVRNVGTAIHLVLSGRVGVQQARPLWDALQPALHEGRSVLLDAGKLDQIDTSILQILCRLRLSNRLSIGPISDDFKAAVANRGLATLLAARAPGEMADSAGPTDDAPMAIDAPKAFLSAAEGRSRKKKIVRQRAG